MKESRGCTNKSLYRNKGGALRAHDTQRKSLEHGGRGGLRRRDRCLVVRRQADALGRGGGKAGWG